MAELVANCRFPSQPKFFPLIAVPACQLIYHDMLKESCDTDLLAVELETGHSLVATGGGRLGWRRTTSRKDTGKKIITGCANVIARLYHTWRLPGTDASCGTPTEKNAENLVYSRSVHSISTCFLIVSVKLHLHCFF